MKEGMEKVANSKSRTFLAFCFSFILGVGIFSWQRSPELAIYLYSSIFLVILAVIWCWREKVRRFLLICLLLLILGGLRYLWGIPNCEGAHICHYNGEYKEITGWITEEPDRKIDSTSYVLKTELGKISMKMPIEPRYVYGDELLLKCSLQAPKDQEDSVFSYSQYLARNDIYSICQSPKILKVYKNKRGNFLAKGILWLKGKVQEKVEALWPEPDASLMGGILYGARSGFPEDLKDNFNRAGITHIVAISGYNISIITQYLMWLLILCGLWRRQAFWGVIVTIFLFVIFTGASASVVRAGVMGVLVLLAGQLGRSSRVENVIIFTAGIMVLLNPFILIWDAGFQLSFLALLGLIFVSPTLKGWLEKTRFSKLPENFREVLVSTFSAMIATLPFLLFQFGRLSIVAPLVNVLVLWIIPWLMLIGFIAILIGFMFLPIAQVIAWIAGLGAKYVIILAEWFGNKSWSALEFRLPWWGMVALYAFIIWKIKKCETKNKNHAIGQGV